MSRKDPLALAFINSFDEVRMTVFIAAPGAETLPVRLFLYIQDNIDPLVGPGATHGR